MTIPGRDIFVWAPYLVAAVVHVVALATDSPVAEPTKMLLMPLLSLPVLVNWRSDWRFVALLAALVCSWLGDSVGVIVEGDVVLPLMLVCFGAAHVVYIVLFVRGVADRPTPRWALVYVLWWMAMVAVVGRHAGALFPAVALYGVVLAGTAAMSSRSTATVALGGALFLTSDSLLAVRLFLPDSAPGWFGPAVMATYTAGQALIVAGVVRRAVGGMVVESARREIGQ
ncbi:lysoplasmalogenase [Gordonia hydrophobica]|uniref:Lysoplasmalogenase n=1 Tax=Gordonia hydrophobica TaxID=40516 RepID=A0ABZ2TYZ2_9ACTN|nr:lysoplasmalogenase [Gordonia hydrophobica]MBM7369450.1 hypothetical protein [Gordonia hydrophobica]